MTLIEYMKIFTRNGGNLEELSLRCATSVGQLKQVAYGRRRAGESLAINIDRETRGVVSCEELRPDVDWAYIRQTGRALTYKRQMPVEGA